MEDRILLVDCAGSKLIPQINDFSKTTYPNAFFANLRMMGSVYPFLIKDDVYFIYEQMRFVRDLETFKDQAIQLIEAQELNKIVVISEPNCLRYNKLLEYRMIDDFGSQEKAFIVALKRFNFFLYHYAYISSERGFNSFLYNYAHISSDKLSAWYIDFYDDPNSLDFREIQVF